jgi:hypothetical protein
MRSLLSERLGVQVPTVLHSPPDVVSLAAAEDAIELADAYGVCDGYPLAESQKLTLRNGGGERADGLWAATRIADFGPRQGTGKNDKIAAWELAHLLLFGTELILHTAHEFPTANESFLRLVAVFENWDDLRAKVARIRYANGEQGIELLSGQRLKYRARTGGSGRGFAKAGLVVYDEAQHLGREHVAASGPAKLANPNSQTWYAGSGGHAASVVAWEIRRAALLGTGGRLAYTEMTGETISVIGGQIQSSVPDPTDREVWYRCIPGLGRWVTEEAVEALYDELGPELFCREILCVWDPEPGAAGGVISAETWAAGNAPAKQLRGPWAFAFDVSPDHAWASISICCDVDGRPHVECAAHQAGTDWLPGKLAAMVADWKPVAVLGDPAGPAGALLPAVAKAGVEVTEVSTREYGQACGLLFEHLQAGTLRHLDDPVLATAVAAAAQAPMGDAWKWSRRTSTGDITPLVAATLALWGWSQHRPTEPAPGVVCLADYLDEE